MVAPIFTEGEMDDIGDELLMLLVSSCEILVGAPKSGGIGSSTDEDYDVVATVPCRVDMPSTSILSPVPGWPEDSAISRMISFQRGTDIVNANRIRVNEELFDVVDVIRPSIHFEVTTLCQKVGP